MHFILAASSFRFVERSFAFMLRQRSAKCRHIVPVTCTRGQMTVACVRPQRRHCSVNVTTQIRLLASAVRKGGKKERKRRTFNVTTFFFSFSVMHNELFS